MKLIEKKIKILKIVSYASAMFTLLIALTMIFSYLQLKSIDPLDSPVLVDLRERYDIDPENQDLKEQIRSIDLMSRKAYFSARWQIEVGTYLLLFGALCFFLSQRFLSDRARKTPDNLNTAKSVKNNQKTRRYLFSGAAIVLISAILISFSLRRDITGPIPATAELAGNADEGSIIDEDLIYPFFRGIGSRGIVKSGDYPTKWDGREGTNIMWKTEIPLPGNNSPIVWDDKIFLTGAANKEATLYCLSKEDGRILWTAPGNNIPGEPQNLIETSPDTGLAASTAASDGEAVVAIFGTGNLISYDLDGNLIWAKNIGVPDNHYGHSSSLVIHENNVLVQFDHSASTSLMAFDIRNGNKLWETKRDVKISWSSPVLADFDGVTQVILSADPLIASYNADTGALLWSIKGMSGEIGPSVGVNSQTVFAASDFSKLYAIRPGENAAIKWEDSEYLPDVASPLATEAFVFVATSWGAVACYAADSGELLWEREFDYGFYSSPVLVGDKIYMVDQAGVTHIVKAAAEFVLVDESGLGEPVVTTPAFAGGQIFIRGRKHLFGISE